MNDHLLVELERLIRRIDPDLDPTTLGFTLETGDDQRVHIWHCDTDGAHLVTYPYDELATARWCEHESGDPKARALDLIGRTARQDLTMAAQSLSILENIDIPDADIERGALTGPNDAVTLAYQVLMRVGGIDQDVVFATIGDAGDYRSVVEVATAAVTQRRRSYLAGTLEHPEVRELIRQAVADHGPVDLDNEVTVAVKNIGTSEAHDVANPAAYHVYGAALLAWAFDALEEPCVTSVPYWLYEGVRVLDAARPSGPYADPVPTFASKPYTDIDPEVLDTATALWQPWTTTPYGTFDTCVDAATALI